MFHAAMQAAIEGARTLAQMDECLALHCGSAGRKHSQQHHRGGTQDGGRHEGHFDARHGRQVAERESTFKAK